MLAVIRAARSEDYASLATLFRQVHNETYPGFFADGVLTVLTNKTISKMEDFLVVEKEENKKGILIGFAKILIETDAVRVDKLYLLKEYHNLGYGKKLLKKCEEIAINKSFRTIKLFVWVKNGLAIEFYTRNGYVSDYKPHAYINIDGTKSDEYDYLMIKSLS